MSTMEKSPTPRSLTLFRSCVFGSQHEKSSSAHTGVNFTSTRCDCKEGMEQIVPSGGSAEWIVHTLGEFQRLLGLKGKADG